VLSFSGSKVSDANVVEVLGVIDRQILQEVVQALGEGDPAHLLQIIEAVHNFGYDLKEFCGELARLMRDLLVLKVFPQPKERAGLLDLPEEEVARLLPHVEKFSREELHSYFRLLLSAHDEVARSSFPRLVLEMALTKMARRKPILSVQEVLERLQAMEERLAEGEPVSRPPQKSPASLPKPPGDVNKEIPEEEEEAEQENLPEQAVTKEGGEVQETLAEEPQEEAAASTPEFEGLWTEFVHFAKKKKPSFASILEHGRPLALNDTVLEIGYPEKSFCLERMQEADNNAVFEALAAEFFKKPLRARVRGLSGGGPSGNNPGNGEKENGRKANLREKQEEALNHPFVRETINIFGGRVVEIKDL
jgi:DNA polymerase-3 subunit gamma/tau